MKTTINNFFFGLIAILAITFSSCGKDEVAEPTPNNPVDTTTHKPTDPTNPVAKYKRTYVSSFDFDSTKTLIMYKTGNVVDSIYKIKIKNDTTFVKPASGSMKVSYNGSAWSFSEISKLEKQDSKYIVTGNFATSTKSASATATEYKSLVVEVTSNGSAIVTYTATNEVSLNDFGGTGLFATPDVNYSYTEKTAVTSVVVSTTASDHNFANGVFTLSQSKLQTITLLKGVNYSCNKIMKAFDGNILAYLSFYTGSTFNIRLVKLLDKDNNVSVSFISDLPNASNGNFFITSNSYMVANQTSHFVTNTNGMSIGNFYKGDTISVPQLQSIYQPQFHVVYNNEVRVVRVQLTSNDAGTGCNYFQIEKVIMYKDYMYLQLKGKNANNGERVDGIYRINMSTVMSQPVYSNSYYVILNVRNYTTDYFVTKNVESVVTDAANSYLGFKQGNSIKMCKADGTLSDVTVEQYNSNTINF